MTSGYIALIRKDAESDYGVEFPDFPGCVTAGKTLDNARRMAAEALALHVEGMVEDGEDLPAPSPLDAVMASRASRGAIAVLVDVDEPETRAVRVNITLPARVLDQIDAQAKRENTTRSGFLVAAARARINSGTSSGPSRRKKSA